MSNDALLHSRLHDTVSALAYSLAGAQADTAPYNDLTQFLLRQHAHMSDPLRAPLAALTLGFDALGVLRTGRRFRHQSPAQRTRQIDAWRRGTFSFQRDFIRFYESLALLALHGREATPPSGTENPRETSPAVLSEPPAEINCDIAVIGSGPGGSITAALLAEAGRDAVLLEEGAYLRADEPAPFSPGEMEKKYRNGGLTVALGRTKIAYVEGRCVGGGSEINSGLYHRTPPEMLETWRRDFQVESLAEADLLPHFEAIERELSVSSMPGGGLPAASLKLHDGATRLGWKSLEVPRWFRYADNSPHGERQSMTRTFVPRFLRAGGRLVPETRVVRLSRDGARWLVHAQHGQRGPLRVSATDVFVCAGAVQTPALLRRSGIGAHIGDSLRLHPTVKLVARFPEEINRADMGVPVHQVKEFSPRLSFGCSISTPPYLALGLLDHRDAVRNVARASPHLANYYAMITGEGSGTVRPLPGFRDPLVRYRLTPRDRADLADGLAKLAEALFAAGATEIFPTLPGVTSLRSLDDLRHLPTELPADAAGLMTIHLFSSCPLGENRARCATDSFGRVHGAENLFIADASLLPGAPGVNPQGTLMALARRNVLHFLG